MADTTLARIGRTTFLIGCITFIVIGLLHTVTQFTTLSKPEVQTAYRAGGPIDVNGSRVDGWDLFAGISVLMGLYSIAIGAFGLVALATTNRADRLPAPGHSAINVVTLGGITAVGATLLGPLQLIGGAVGMVLFGIPLAAARRRR
ncbi:MAG: hypothetical protein AAFO29_15675 [Actinomycetota bacterium]